MLAELLAHERNRFRIERHRYRLARFRLVGMHPRQSPCQINLCPLQTGDIGGPQASRERKRRHVGQMLRQLGQNVLRFIAREEAYTAGRFLQHAHLRRPIALVFPCSC